MKSILKRIFVIFETMVAEDGNGTSSRRVIALMFSAFAIWAGRHIVINYKEYALTVFGYTLIIVGILLGVTTVSEIARLTRGSKEEKDETNKN